MPIILKEDILITYIDTGEQEILESPAKEKDQVKGWVVPTLRSWLMNNNIQADNSLSSRLLEFAPEPAYTFKCEDVFENPPTGCVPVTVELIPLP